MENSKDSYVQRLESKLETLKKSEGVILSNKSLGNSIRPRVLNSVKEVLGIILDIKTLEYYASLNGLKLRWDQKSSNKGDERIAGEISIPNYSFMLESPGFKFDFDVSRGRFDTFISKLYLFDHYPESLQSTLKVGLDLREGAEHLWLWYDDGEKYPLTLSIPEYFERLLETKGFIGWQYFFIDLDACDFEDAYFSENFASVPNDGITFMEEFLEVMPKLFPDQDFTFYKERLAFFKAANAEY